MKIWFGKGWLSAVLLLAAITLASCGDSSGNSATRPSIAQAEKTGKTFTLPGVDASKLDADSKSMFEAVVNDLLSPCGDASTIAECIIQKKQCDRCVPAARFVMRLVDGGYTRDEIKRVYRGRYDEKTKYDLKDAGSPSYGPMLAAVTLDVFSDFQCPHCRLAAPVLHQLVDRYRGKVRLAHRFFPLTSHAFSHDAARAAAAADMQGKFWPMHDLLFEHQEELNAEKVTELAKAAGLDMKRFKKDCASKQSDEKVKRDRKAGENAGVEGTPAIFVNGRRYELPFEDLPQYIEEELGG